MYQIDNSTAAATQPASTTPGVPGFFTDGSLTGGAAPTILPAEWLNAVQMELLNVIESAGLTPNKAQFTQLYAAIQTILQGATASYGVDSGAANAYAVTYAPAVTTVFGGLRLRFMAKNANTGPSTFSPNGLTAEPIIGGAHAALQSGEIVANGEIEIVWDSALSAWVLLENTGGATQVGAATQSKQAMQLGQATGRLLNVQTITASSTYNPISANTTFIVVEGCGGGGAGGGATAGSSTTNSVGGGGSGATYVKAIIHAGFTSIPVTIGAGGTGAVAGAGSSGGTSTFGSFLTLPGGPGGGTTGSATGPACAGGGAQSAPPTVGSGATSINSTRGGAGTTGYMVNLSGGSGGFGGSTNIGAGAPGSSLGAGASASAPGGGGGGAQSTSSVTTASAGGNGGNGAFIVWEYA